VTRSGLTRSTKNRLAQRWLQTQAATSQATKSSSYNASTAMKPHPTFWVTGSCDNGQMGTGDYLQLHSHPVKHDVLSRMNITSISVGLNHAMGVNDQGQLFAWGRNDEGQLGQGDFEDRSIPTEIPLNKVNPELVVNRTVCGPWSSFVLATDKKTGKKYIYSFGLLRDSNSTAMIRHNTPTVFYQDSINFTDVTCAQYTFGFLSDKGEIYTWGKGKFGTLGTGDQAADNYRAPEHVTSLRGQYVTTVRAGWGHMLALTRDGHVYSWGSNKHGQCGVGHHNTLFAPTKLNFAPLTNIKQIACGQSHSLALSDDNQLYIWGSHKDAKLALPDVSEDQYQPVSMNKYYRQFDNEKIVQIAAGCDHSAVLTEKGHVYTWGFGQHGALGLGYLENPSSPQRMRFEHAVGKITQLQCSADLTFLRTEKL
jgi:alpha-tubulin suppressor-like RCC1 family protein